VDVRIKLAFESVVEAEPTAPFCVTPQTPLGNVFGVLEQNNGGALVCHEGMLIGIFTERDGVRALAHGTPLDTPVGTLMTVSPVTARATTSIATVVRKMAVGGYRRLPVLDDAGRPCGVITTAGLVHYLTEHFARTVYNLPPSAGAVPQERDGA
jgi:CBS domain-containing protein